MRIERLSLLRYGPFTDTVLDFRPDARLHIVYGPNEAGKSSALQALSDLFFGFPRSTAHFNFRHEAKSLRIGATVVSRDGERLSFRRRRGTKDTLIADTEAETPLRDDCLSPFCGLLTQTIFERAFALDAHRLEQGGAAMLAAQGEIGSLLFSASSGLLGLSELRRRIEDEADLIWGPRASASRKLYQVRDAYDAAKRAEKDQALVASQWTSLIAEGRRLEGEMAALEAARLATRRRLDALGRLERLQPLVAGIDAEAAMLALDADLSGWPEGTAERLETVLRQQGEGLAALTPARDHCTALESRLAARVVHGAALEAAADIAALAGLKGADEAYRRDLPRVRAELAQREQQMDMLARELGFAAVADLEAQVPGLVLIDRLKRLAEEGQRLALRRETIAAQRTEAEQALGAIAASLPTGRLIDPKPWAKQLAALAPDLQRAAEEDQRAARLAEAERAESAALARLVPSLPAGADPLSLPLPDAAEIAEAERQMGRAAQGLATAREGLERLSDEQQRLMVDLAGLGREGPIVTTTEIGTARERRDATVAGLGPAALEGLARLPAEIAEADRLSDAARGNAERIARHAALTLDLERRAVTLSAQQRQVDAAAHALAEAEQAYRALFAASGIVPLEPARMQAWRQAIEEIRRQAESQAGERAALAEARLAAERVLPLLRGMADAVGTPGATRLPLAALHRAFFDRLEEIAHHWESHRQAEGRREAEEQRLTRLAEDARTCASEAEDWAGRFDQALPELGLPPGTPPETVLMALQHFARLPELRQQRDELLRRVRGIEREIANFESRVEDLATRVEPALCGHPVEVIVNRLDGLAEAAKREHQQAQADQEALATARLVEARAARTVEEAGTALSALVGDALLDPSVLLSRLKERDLRLKALENARDRLAQQFPGLDEAAARAEIADHDAAVAALEAEALRERQEAEVQAHGQLRSEIDRHERLRREREEGVSAERAAFDKQAAEEEGRQLARDWAVRKIAAEMLTKAMERFRQSRASPLMLSAGTLFSTLTGGRFVGLRQDLDDHDAIVLQAERDTGERVPIAGLSEGTSHQLYLALRLAFLEDYASRNEPPPLICDDLFQSFDDARTAHGITTLASTSPAFQTILLTHHQSVVDIARAELGDGVDVIRL